MIRQSTVIAAAAILLSLLVHVVGFGITSRVRPEPPVEEGTSEVVEVGNAFEDLAETLPEPSEPEVAPNPEPEPVTAPEPETVEALTSEALVASADPQDTASPDTGSTQIEQPDTAGASETEQGQIPDPETVEPSGNNEGTTTQAAVTPPVELEAVAEAPKGEPLESVQPVETVAVEPVPSPPVARPPQQLAALPEAITPTVPVTPSLEPSTIPVIPLEAETVAPEIPEAVVAPTSEDLETVEAEEDASDSELTVTTSLRPQLPNRRPSGTPSRNVQPAPSRTFESPLAAYKRNGTDPFNPRANGTRSGGTGAHNSRNTGNSNASNYAGLVLTHLNRVANVTVSVKGSAQVLFEINRDGTLASVRIGRSSGSDEIERAAIAQVRDGAPFPIPPQGASRKLAFFYQN